VWLVEQDHPQVMCVWYKPLLVALLQVLTGAVQAQARSMALVAVTTQAAQAVVLGQMPQVMVAAEEAVAVGVLMTEAVVVLAVRAITFLVELVAQVLALPEAQERQDLPLALPRSLARVLPDTVETYFYVYTIKH
jgi:hypothetical protein